jgi:hypothetical protein
MKSRIILLVATIWLGCLSHAFAILQWPMTVTNIAELKSLHLADVALFESAATVPINPAVYVLGYYYPGDRGGGMFEWDPNMASTPDDGYYIVTNVWSTGNGRWVRRLNGEVPNVKMWGAMANIPFVTSVSIVSGAHDDTTNIQNAINGVFNTFLGQLYSELLIPAGWYKVSGTLILPEQVRLKGESSRMCHLVKPYQVNSDILHTLAADQAIQANDGQAHWGGPTRIEDLFFEFAQDDGEGEVGHNETNAAIVMCSPEEGNTIRNVDTHDGGYGIRCFGGGGAVAAFRDVTFENTAIAGICFEPVPGATDTANQVSIKGISGDHRWDDSRSNACLVKFVSYFGPAMVEDINAEGLYGGGVISHQYPADLVFYAAGNLTIKDGFLNSGLSISGLDAPRSFLVLKSAGWRTTAVTMENIHTYGATNTIRDELTDRNICGPDADSDGLNQAVCRSPLQYESYNDGGIWTDGVTRSKWNRLVVGGEIIYSFIPPTTNAWYRILGFADGRPMLGARVTVTSMAESSEFNVSVMGYLEATALELNVTRSTRDDGFYYPPAVTKVRAGSYQDASSQVYPFVDIYVERAVANPADEGRYKQITIGIPLSDTPNILGKEGRSILLNPVSPLASIVPSGCTLLQSTTSSLVR